MLVLLWESMRGEEFSEEVACSPRRLPFPFPFLPITGAGSLLISSPSLSLLPCPFLSFSLSLSPPLSWCHFFSSPPSPSLPLPPHNWRRLSLLAGNSSFVNAFPSLSTSTLLIYFLSLCSPPRLPFPFPFLPIAGAGSLLTGNTFPSPSTS